MNAKDLFESDLDLIFNIDEFGEEHEINGKTYIILIDDELLQERKTSGVYNEGLYDSEVLFFIRKNQLSYIPEVEEHILFDKKRYRVGSVNSDGGVLEISLGAVQS
ncbi:hypothetical protein [Vallitalea maricola]|uniref:Uncharacterized protein n=1 Tax=Vallitalea maricola TaxID=3074433 RepID=A0ACB5UP09_9FIRM|nr:hypothetical protein AN2V17_35820 [Vallitalea sp. AN17-2]